LVRFILSGLFSVAKTLDISCHY